jgi:hypothetical protein
MRRFIYSLPNVIKEERIGVVWSTHKPTGKYNTELDGRLQRKRLLRRPRCVGRVLQK